MVLNNNFVDRASKILIPVSIVADRDLSILEVIVEYMKEELKYNYKQIAGLTNRDERTIWTVHSRAKKKRVEKPKLQIKSSVVKIPASVLFDRSLSSFETVVEYMKEQQKFSFREIGTLTNRDERTIWTLYNRVKQKRKDM